MNLLEKAIAVAVEAHAGQRRKDGRPYILHPLQVMLKMENELEMITAVLHDVVEDTAVTLDDLAQMGFPDEVLAAVELLTHLEGTPYEAYIRELKPHDLARRVKLADLEDNMDVRHLVPLRAKDWARLQRYGRAWAILQNG